MRYILLRAVFTLFAALSTSSQAQEVFPRLIRIIVPFAAGASNDVIARAVASPLAKRLETNIIVENRPGAGGISGSDAVAKGARDGSSLLMTSSSFLTVAATQQKLPYDAIASFAPVAIVAQATTLLAVPSGASFKSASDLFAAARAKPGALTYGTPGVGSLAHLLTEWLMGEVGVQMTHVPYKGAATAAIDLASGQIDSMISTKSTLAPLMRGGRVRVLAVTSSQAHPSFPNVPTLIATVPGFSIESWVGTLTAAGTPARVIDRFNREISEISATPELANLLEPDGMLPVSSSPDAFASRIKEELAQWKRIAVIKKISAE